MKNTFEPSEASKYYEALSLADLEQRKAMCEAIICIASVQGDTAALERLLIMEEELTLAIAKKFF